MREGHGRRCQEGQRHGEKGERQRQSPGPQAHRRVQCLNTWVGPVHQQRLCILCLFSPNPLSNPARYYYRRKTQEAVSFGNLPRSPAKPHADLGLTDLDPAEVLVHVRQLAPDPAPLLWTPGPLFELGPATQLTPGSMAASPWAFLTLLFLSRWPAHCSSAGPGPSLPQPLSHPFSYLPVFQPLVPLQHIVHFCGLLSFGSEMPMRTTEVCARLSGKFQGESGGVCEALQRS